MTTPYRSVLLFGAPGVGKGTQGKLLGQLPGLYHMSSGDMFRGLDPESELGRQIRAIMASGELVSDELTVKLWKQHAAETAARGGFDPSADLLVLDGIPRNKAQAELMADAVDVLAVIDLDASDRAALVDRLKGRALKEGRADDAKEDVIRNRFRVFDQETTPVLDRYDQQIVHRVDPMGSVLEVFARVVRVAADAHSTTLQH